MGSYKRSSISGCCKDCQERFPACHDVCVSYLKAKAEWQEAQKQIKEAKSKDKTFNSYFFKQVEKCKKIKNQKGR